MPTVAEAFHSAQTVFAQTGVDPLIIATMMQTEGPVANGYSMSLGIQTGSPWGKGSSGGVLPSASNEPGQPSQFWSYTTGAEAAQAFATYIAHQFPNDVQYLGNAGQFFDAMKSTNYDTVFNVKGNPSSGMNWAAVAQYWDGQKARLVQTAGNLGFSGYVAGQGPPQSPGSGIDPSGAGSGNPVNNPGGGSGPSLPNFGLIPYSGAGVIFLLGGGFLILIGALIWKGDTIIKVASNLSPEGAAASAVTKVASNAGAGASSTTRTPRRQATSTTSGRLIVERKGRLRRVS